METTTKLQFAEEQATLVELAELTEQHAMLAMCHSYKDAMNEGEVYHHQFSNRVCGLYSATDLLFVNRLMVGAADLLTEDLLDEAITFYRSKSCARMMLHVSPFNFTDDHRALIGHKGGRFLGHWVKHLKAPSRQTEADSKIGVRLAREEEYAQIGEILLTAFAWPASLLKFCQEGLGKGGWKTYVAELGNEVIATGSLFTEDGVAALGVGGTLPAFQRHGAQGALIRAREDEALNQGCSIIFTETIEPTEKNPAPSFRNMQRHGFRELYRRVNWVFEIS